MKSRDERAAIARKFDEARPRNLTRSGIDMSFPKPTHYPFWFRIVVVITLVLLAINLFFFIGPVTAFITWTASNLSIGGKELVAALGTLVASFAGAWFAFRFARQQREKEKIDDEVAAGNRALFTLSAIWNALRQYQKEIVERHRGQPDAWLNLDASKPIDDGHTYLFDVKDLSFLLQNHAATFQQVILQGVRFRHVSYVIDQHTKLVRSEVFPRLTAAGVLIADKRPEAEIEQILGVGVVRQLKVLTDAIIKSVDEDVKSSREAFIGLRTALKTVYPRGKFINLPPEKREAV